MFLLYLEVHHHTWEVEQYVRITWQFSLAHTETYTYTHTHTHTHTHTLYKLIYTILYIENSGSSVRLCFFGAPKSLQMVIAAMKLKDTYSLEGKL